MTYTRCSAQLLLLLLFFSANVVAQKAGSLSRSVPEKEGVASDDIVKFLDAAAKSKTEFHSFMLCKRLGVYGLRKNIFWRYVPARGKD